MDTLFDFFLFCIDGGGEIVGAEGGGGGRKGEGSREGQCGGGGRMDVVAGRWGERGGTLSSFFVYLNYS